MEGKDLGEMRQIWQDTAASEMRLNLMSALKDKNLGFNEIEGFSLGLSYGFKSEKMKEMKDKPIEKVIKAAMTVKMQDEIHHHYELTKKREIKKKRLREKHHPNTKTYKKIIQYLRGEAAEIKRIQGDKYREKIRVLEERYRDTEEEKLKAPQRMEKYGHLSVFNADKYDKIEVEEIQVPKIGEITLSIEEESILRRHPKFAIMQNLQEDTMKEDMEKAYSLVRMELRDEDEEENLSYEIKDENGGTISGEPDEEKKKRDKEEVARGRQVFDPLSKIYDERKRRVTDLAECSRVTLPKPLSITREAQIETRRELHDKIYQKYRKENCGKTGEQESNLTVEERKGLKSLMKRVKDEEIVIIKTDKSGKLSVTDRDKYLEMGKVHVGGDKKVNREKIRETDKTLNEHSTAWCSIWGTGKHHGQEDRVQSSKVSRSENRAKLYLTHKDHKKEQEKTRPIGTANSSNTRAFANSVSDLLEAVASEREEKYEVISSEDMLYSVKEHNTRVEEMGKEDKKRKERKRSCWSCKAWTKKCETHKIKCEEEKEEAGKVAEIMNYILENTIELSECKSNRQECEDCESLVKKTSSRECKDCGEGI